MVLDNLTITDESPLSAVGNEANETTENVITVFDLANEIGNSLKDLENQLNKNDTKFIKILDDLEQKINQLEK